MPLGVRLAGYVTATVLPPLMAIVVALLAVVEARDEELVLRTGVALARAAAVVAYASLSSPADPWSWTAWRSRSRAPSGLVTYPAHAGTAADLVAAADGALYRANAQGKDRIEWADAADGLGARRSLPSAP